jgi:hypothetical protein
VRMCNRFSRFFLTIVVVQNVPLRMTDMASGSDVIPKGIPLGARMRNRKLSNILPSGAFWAEMTSSNVTRRVPLEVTLSEVHLGCWIERSRPINSMATGISTITGYMPFPTILFSLLHFLQKFVVFGYVV